MSRIRKLEKIRFVEKPENHGSDRIHWLRPHDMLFVLARLPEETWSRLRTVYLTDRSRGARVLGYVTQGRREITMCALPRSISLTRFLANGQRPKDFGALRNRPWPATAIRRFLLYDVFLHELGHLQIVNEKASSARRKFAHGRKAEEFAEHWRRHLWSSDPRIEAVLNEPIFQSGLGDQAHYPPSEV